MNDEEKQALLFVSAALLIGMTISGKHILKRDIEDSVERAKRLLEIIKNK